MEYRKPTVSEEFSDVEMTTSTMDAATDLRNYIHTKGALPSAETASMTREGSTLNALGFGMKQVKELISTIAHLSKLGVSNSTLSRIPKIVVVGDQSAGKSSLVEAICELKLPRSSGTCTRCVTQVNLTATEEPGAVWTARISLVREYSYGGPLFPPQPGNKFHPWILNSLNDTEAFLVVTDPNGLDDAVRRAQTAILNPGQSSDRYRRGHYDANDLQVEFSPNIVCVDVSSPSSPELSLYDLPGVISQTENATNQHLPKIVRNLVKKYIAQENALVLLACSMEGDLHISQAAAIVRKTNDNGGNAVDRCLGVMTKPDRLPKGHFTHNLHGILNGDTFRLGHDYYVTKQPDQVALDRGISHAEARIQEIEFFAKTEPWAVTFERFKARFGTQKLVEALSTKLAGMASHSLPVIREEIQRRRHQISAQLKNLPEPPTHNAIHVVFSTISEFTSLVEKCMEGAAPMTDFLSEFNHVHLNAFVASLATMRPSVRLLSEVEQFDLEKFKKINTSRRGATNNGDRSISLISDDEDAQSTPTKKRKVMHTDSGSPIPIRSSPLKKQVGVEIVKAQTSGVVFTLDEIRAAIARFTTKALATEVDSRAKDDLIKQCFEQWEQPTTAFFRAVESSLERHIKDAMNKTFAAWRNTDLYRNTATIIRGFLSMHVSNQRDVVAPRALRHEKFQRATVYKEHLKELTNKEQSFLHHKRLRTRSRLHYEELEAKTGKRVAAEKQEALDDSKLEEVVGYDAWKDEIGVAADVRAYYHFASMRYVDAINLSIWPELFEKLKTDLTKELTNGLELNGPDALEKCVMLLAEDPQRAKQRSDLQKELHASMTAETRLDKLDRDYYRPSNN